MELGESQVLALGSKLALPSPRLVPHRVKTTSLSENNFFDPFLSLSRVRISLVATSLPHTLDWVHLVPCGSTPLKDHSSRTMRDTNSSKDFRDWETPSHVLSHKPNPQILSPFSRLPSTLLTKQAIFIFKFWERVIRVTHIH